MALSDQRPQNSAVERQLVDFLRLQLVSPVAGWLL